MKKALLFFILFTVITISKAQTTLDTPLNFTVKDVHGNTLQLYDILNNGQMVVIDFFSAT